MPFLRFICKSSIPPFPFQRLIDLDKSFPSLALTPYHSNKRDRYADPTFLLSSILTPSSPHHPTAFTTALLFAQDYGILAASLEDRPFVPVSTVVVEGAPRDMKACFRRWVDRSAGVGVVVRDVGAEVKGKGKGGEGEGALRRGRSLRVVGLGEAIAAVNR